MAFEALTTKLSEVFKNLKSKGRLTDKDVTNAMREVKLALLEADVNFKIVKDFVKRVTDKSIGESVLQGLNPAQQVIKIVNDELIDLLGTTQSKLTFSSKPPTVYIMVGLQGAGKTTTCGKLAAFLKKQGKNPLLVACDVYRPAAIKQLKVVGSTCATPVFEMSDTNKPLDIAKAAVANATRNQNDVVIIDTAGRLHIDADLMQELNDIKNAVRPQEILLVADAMTGQDAVNVAQSFNEQLGVDGIILTKLDGDARGGCALSICSITQKPIKFVGMGEKQSELEPFFPDRMASRILGMGDVLTLIEKAQDLYDEKEARELEAKIRKNDFTLVDFLAQMQQVKKMGPLKNMLGMLPGMGKLNVDEMDLDEKVLTHVEAIILSMTPYERENPDVLNGSRKKRIAMGSGRNIQEVNRLLKQFEEMKKVIKQFSDVTKGKKGKLNFPFFK